MTANEALSRVLNMTIAYDSPVSEGEADDMIVLLAEYGFEIVPKPASLSQPQNQG